MQTIESLLTKEKEELERIIKETRKRLANAPQGHLRIVNKKGRLQYYYCNSEEEKNEDEKGNNGKSNDGKCNGEKNNGGKHDEEKRNGGKYNGGKCNDGKCSGGKRDEEKRNDGTCDDEKSKSRKSNGKYLKKSQIMLAKRIAQKDYDNKIIKNAIERVDAINYFLKKYETTSLKRLYEVTNPNRKALICVSVISDDEYVRKWQAVEYKGKEFVDDMREIMTERGERVRSKSEKIIADKLNMLGIPYRYEYPLALEGNMRFYPDFTILKMPEREEVYLEHFGMMDDKNYVDMVMNKLDVYEKNGIYLGVNLFITYETGKNPLNTKLVDQLLRKWF